MPENQINSEEAILGTLSVPLELGGAVELRPWGIRTGRRMMGRLKVIMQIVFGLNDGGLNLAVLLESSYGEVVAMTAASMGVEVTELEDETKYTLADLFALVDGVIKINFTERPGLLKNAQSLLGTLQEILPQGAVEEAVNKIQEGENPETVLKESQATTSQ